MNINKTIIFHNLSVPNSNVLNELYIGLAPLAVGSFEDFYLTISLSELIYLKHFPLRCGFYEIFKLNANIF